MACPQLPVYLQRQKNNGMYDSFVTEMAKNIIGIPRISVEFKTILNLQVLFERKNLVDSVKSESFLFRKEPDSHYVNDHHFASPGKMSKSLQNRNTVVEHKVIYFSLCVTTAISHSS